MEIHAPTPRPILLRGSLEHRPGLFRRRMAGLRKCQFSHDRAPAILTEERPGRVVMILAKRLALARTAALCAVALFVTCRPASCQLVVGEPAPALKADAVDGTAIEIAVESGRLSVRRGSATEHPKALAIHFFQPDLLLLFIMVMIPITMVIIFSLDLC